MCLSFKLEFSNSSNFLDASIDSVRLIKFIKCVNALANLKIFIGLSLLISKEIFLNLFLLFLFLVFALDSNLIFSTNLKKLSPSCFFSTLPKIFPKYLTSSLKDFVGMLS